MDWLSGLGLYIVFGWAGLIVIVLAGWSLLAFDWLRKRLGR